MAIQTINIGNRVNDGLGDDLRTAFQKVNANFTELSDSITVVARNTGDTGVGIFRDKIGNELRFKKLVASTKIQIEDRPETVVIYSTQPDAFTTINTNSGTVEAEESLEIRIQGASTYTEGLLPSQTGRNISVRKTATGTITIDSVLDLKQILTTMDFGFIEGTFLFPTQLALQSSNIDFGTLENPGALDVDLGSI